MTAPRPPARYAHAGNLALDAVLRGRTAATSAAFLLPHLQPGMRLLDAGCALGAITAGLSAHVSRGCVVGLDREARLLALARDSAPGAASPHYVRGDVLALPFPDGTFDALFAGALLFHLADPAAALAEFRRVLRPGGVAGVLDWLPASVRWLPEAPERRRLLELEVAALTALGARPGFGSALEPALSSAGFTRVHIGTLPYATRTPAECAALVDYFRARFGAPLLRDIIHTAGWATPPEYDALLATLPAWAAAPDAHYREDAAWALGWTPG